MRGILTIVLSAATVAGLLARGTGGVIQQEMRGVSYVERGTPDQVLDLAVPQGVEGFSTVMFIHGGSLRESGERRTSPVYARVCEPFLASGVACATIDYRLAPTHRWPAMPSDVAAAFSWVKRNIGALGGSPDRVFVFGHSSGCQLAAVLGTNPKYLDSVGLTPEDVAGVIAMGCTLTPLDRTLRRAAEAGMEQGELAARWKTASGEDTTYETFEDRLDSDPSRFIGEHVPPTLVVLAEAERFRPPILEQGARFAGLMFDARRPADVVVVPGRHMTSIGELHEPGSEAFRAIRAFIEDPGSAGLGSRGWR